MNKKFGLFKTPNPHNPKQNCKCVIKGNLKEINNFAKKQNWIWKKDQSLFEGYWIDTQTGDAYLFDTLCE